MRIQRFTTQEWQQFSENAHLACFNENRPDSMNRIDFAMMVVNDDTPLAYMTCRETDSETVYMAYGGAFPSSRNSALSFKAYKLMVDELSHQYKRAHTLIENINSAMIRFAMKAGLKATGIREFDGNVLVEHSIFFNEREKKSLLKEYFKSKKCELIEESFGFLAFQVRGQNDDELFIAEVFVSPEKRKKGHLIELAHAVEAKAKERGCVCLTCSIYPSAHSVYDFNRLVMIYLKFGFVMTKSEADKIYFMKLIKEDKNVVVTACNGRDVISEQRQ